MSHKIAETLTSPMHLAQKLNEYTVPWRFKFYKGDKSLEDEECNGPPWAADNNQEPSSKL